MSDSIETNEPDVGKSVRAPRKKRRTLLYALIAIAVLLGIFAFALIEFLGDAPFRTFLDSRSGGDRQLVTIPSRDVDPSAGDGSSPSGDSGDTVLPADIAPHEWINAYFEDLIGGNYAAAQKRLPASIRVTLTAEQLQTKTQRDPVISVSTEHSAIEDNQDRTEVTSIAAHQSGATTTQTWLFERRGESWALIDREVDGMPN